MIGLCVSTCHLIVDITLLTLVAYLAIEALLFVSTWACRYVYVSWDSSIRLCGCPLMYVDYGMYHLIVAFCEG